MEPLDEFQSITTGYGRSSNLKYQTYYDLLINACVRYDKTKKANIAKQGHIYQTTFSQNNDDFIGQIPSETPISDPYMGIDTPSDEFYNINTNQSGPPISARHKLQPRLLRTNPNTKPNTFPKKPARQKWTGPIYLPGHIYKLLSQEAKDALQNYNVEAIQKFKASRNLNETELIHNVYEHAQKNYQLPLINKSFKNVNNSILTKIYNHLQMISWNLLPVKIILMINLIKFCKLIKHIYNHNLKLKHHLDK